MTRPEDRRARAAVRALPERRPPSELVAWRGEVRAIAVVAAGGIAAGAATVAAVSAAKAMLGEPQPTAAPARPGRSRRDRQPLVPGRRSPARPLMPAPQGPRRPRPRRVAGRRGRPPCIYRLPSVAAIPTASPAAAAASTSGSCRLPAGRSSPGPGRSRARAGRDRGAARPGRLAAAPPRTRPRPDADLEVAIGRTRHALAVDDDLRPLPRTLPRRPADRPAHPAGPWYRVRRRPDPWEAFAWAVTEQLIESQRGGADPAPHRAPLGQRRLSCRRAGARPLADVPGPEVIAGLAPAELAALDLAPKRAVALDQGRPRDRPRPLRPRRSRPTTPACADHRDRPVDDPVPRPSTAAATPTRCPPATSPT